MDLESLKGLLGKAQSFLPLLLMVLVFYFLIIRPQNKKKKEVEEMLSNLSIGDEILTHSGMYGKIISIKDQRICIEIANGVNIEIIKNAVIKVQQPS